MLKWTRQLPCSRRTDVLWQVNECDVTDAATNQRRENKVKFLPNAHCYRPQWRHQSQSNSIQFNPIQFSSIAFDVDGDSSTINRRFKSGGFVNAMASTSVLKLSCFVVWCQRDLQEKMETGSLIRNIKQSKFPMELIQLMTIIVMVVYTGKDGALLWWHWWTSSFRVETAAVDLHWPLIAELVTSRDLCSGVFSPFHSFPSSSPLTEQITVLKCISNLSPESCTNHWRVYLTDTFHGLDSCFSLIACLMIKLVEAK